MPVGAPVVIALNLGYNYKPKMKADISFEDFQKLDLRIGKVISAEAVAGSVNLLRLKVNLGNDHGVRSILSGIARWYKPKELKGKKFIFVTKI